VSQGAIAVQNVVVETAITQRLLQSSLL